MAKEPRKPKPNTYQGQDAAPLNNLVFILPMLVIFQAGTAFYGTNLLAPRDLHKLLKYFGATAAYLPAVFVVVVMLVQHALHKDPWEIQPKALAGMLGESIIWMIPLIVLVHVAGYLAAGAQAAPAGPTGISTLEGCFQQVLLCWARGCTRNSSSAWSSSAW